MHRAAATSLKQGLAEETGASAVEFAMIAPILLMLTFGIVGYGTVLGTYHGVQELASEAARASVAGLTDPERATLAQSYLRANASAYAFLDPGKLALTTQPTGSPPTGFEVTVSYDMSGSFIYRLGRLVPMPSPLIQRSAVVRYGGY
jgi:Flp pilus assembly protein TadG